jgi:hypothetical protein
MQDRAPDSNSSPHWEGRSDVIATLRETNSAKRIAAQLVRRDTQISQRRLRFGHQPFPARLVDRGLGTVRHDGVQTFLPGSDSRR